MTDLTNKVAQTSEKGYDFLRIYVTGNDGNKNLLVFAVMFRSPILDSKKKLPTGYRPEYQQKKLNHLILTLTQQCLIKSMIQ